MTKTKAEIADQMEDAMDALYNIDTQDCPETDFGQEIVAFTLKLGDEIARLREDDV